MSLPLVLDQGLSSGWSLVLVVVASRELAIGDLAQWSAVYLWAQLAMVLNRSAVSLPNVRLEAGDVSLRIEFGSTVLVLGPVLLLAVGYFSIAGVALSVPVMMAATALVASIVLQDAARLRLLRQGNHRRAVGVDGAILLTLVSLGLLPLVPIHGSLTRALAFQAAVVSAVTAAALPHLLPDLVGAARLLATRFRIGGALLIDQLAGLGSTYATLVALTPHLPAEQFAGLRVALTAMGPANVLGQAVAFGLLAQFRRHPTRRLGLAAEGSLVSAILALVWTAVMVLAPDRLGASVFGGGWIASTKLLWPCGAATAAGLLGVGASALLAFEGSPKLISVSRLIVLPFVLAVPIGLGLHGAVPYLWGLAASNLIGVVVAWLAVRSMRSKSMLLRKEVQVAGAAG